MFFWRPAIDRYFSYNVYLLANKLMMMMMMMYTSQARESALRDTGRVGEGDRQQAWKRRNEHCSQSQLERGAYRRQLATGGLSLGNAVHADRRHEEDWRRLPRLRVRPVTFSTRGKVGLLS